LIIRLREQAPAAYKLKRLSNFVGKAFVHWSGGFSNRFLGDLGLVVGLFD
jgi:hypothetical protein